MGRIEERETHGKRLHQTLTLRYLTEHDRVGAEPGLHLHRLDPIDRADAIEYLEMSVGVGNTRRRVASVELRHHDRRRTGTGRETFIHRVSPMRARSERQSTTRSHGDHHGEAEQR